VSQVSTPERFLAVVNPAARGGACGKLAPAAIGRLRAAGLEIDVVETTAPGHGRQVAHEGFVDGVRKVIAVGGDGTSFEVLNGLLSAQEVLKAKGIQHRPWLGLLPLGSGNSFLRDFSDQGVEYAIESIIGGRSRACDVIRVTHRDGALHFINIFSVGFVAAVGVLRNRRFAQLGELGYVFAVATEVARLRPARFPMRVDGGAEDRAPLTFVSINNSRFTGGKMMMAPDADTSDARVDVIRVGVLGRLSLLRTFPKIFKGTHLAHPALSTAQARSITFNLEQEIDVLIDGEVLRLLPQRLDVLPGAVDVMV
jgi:YegS/Rv2252/BmrU family lipid kinase